MGFWKENDESADAVKGSEYDWGNEDAVPKLGEAPGVVAPAQILRPSLGRDTAVTGRLSFSGPTRIDGKLRGEVRAGDLLVVGEEGFVDGQVRALKLVVLGEVRGEVRATQSVEIGSSGRVIGIIETQSLVVKEGGYLDGDCRISPARSNVHVLRPANA